MIQQPAMQSHPPGDSVKRIFVAEAGSSSFVIVQLQGDSENSWMAFLEEIRQSLDLPMGSNLKLSLAEINASVTSPSQLQSNDRIFVQNF